MMAFRGFVMGAVLMAALMGIIAVFGQGDEMKGAIKPFVVDLRQQVPFTVSVPVDIDDGAIVTTVTPLTVSIDLRVGVDAEGGTVAVIGPAAPASVVVATATPAGVSNDNPLTPYTIVRSDYDISEDREGVIVTLRGIVVANWTAMMQSDDPSIAQLVQQATASAPNYKDDDLIVFVSLSVENTTNEIHALYPMEDGVIAVGGVQSAMSAYQFANTRNLIGDIFPGVTKKDFVAVGLRGLSVKDFAETQVFQLRIARPVLNFDSVGDEDYMFRVELPVAE